LKQAQTVVDEAQSDVDQAKLDLRYCTVEPEIDGVVTRRNVNPGNYVHVGQSLMAVRSLNDMWVDVNFKETELRELRIGQHVDLETDMYGKHLKFEGRISGFIMGTGSTLALLPAQNATGNFVKVVQRLPARVDPVVDIPSAPTGPNAGKFLHARLEFSSSTGIAKLKCQSHAHSMELKDLPARLVPVASYRCGTGIGKSRGTGHTKSGNSTAVLDGFIAFE
jgi:membrane fusion protein (multidrug efflux system)